MAETTSREPKCLSASVPSSTDGVAIQKPYYHAFGSIWEYLRVFLTEEIDWVNVLQEGCPRCGGRDCWRPLTPYWRWVVDLLPFRKEKIPIARFFCRTTGATFSVFPTQVVPYRLYTARSIVFCLLLADAARADGLSLFAVAEKLIEPESKVSGCLLASWLSMAVSGLRKAYPELRRWAGELEVQSGRDRPGQLAEVTSTCWALGIRGPPKLDDIEGLDEVVGRYVRSTGHFLFGVPSQERTAAGRGAP